MSVKSKSKTSDKNCLSVDDSNKPSGRSTPVFSWSPLPQRKKLAFTNSQEETTSCESPIEDLYPNCDVNIWLRSCDSEIIKPLTGKVSGVIPQWLNGSLLRNGPGSLKVGKMEFKHLFDSSALIHRFAIEKGNVTYQCRFLQSDVYKQNQAAQRIVVTEFGTCSVPDPCQTIFHRVAAVFNNSKNTSDNAMISLYPFGDEMYAFTESPVIHRVNKITLETEERIDVSKHVAIVNHTSHPHIMNDGTVFNVGMSVTASGLAHNIICFPKNENDEPNTKSMFEKASVVGTVATRWPLHPSYMHTFGITDNYFIIVEQPLSVSVTALVTQRFKNEPMASCFRWYNDEQTQIHVISRKTGKAVYVFHTEAFFYLHIINQFEKSGHLVLDICCYKDPAMLDCMYVETMKQMQQNPDYAKMFRGRPLRFVLPLLTKERRKSIKEVGKDKDNLVRLPNTTARAFLTDDGKIFVKPELLCDLGCETPRIHYEQHLGKVYQFFYAISSDVDCDNPGTIIKVDTMSKTRLTWCEENCYPSEPIFVPSPNPQFEDDGVVISAMIWGREVTNKVGLLVLDAQSFKELGRAEFVTKGPAPKCLHGWFAPNKVEK